jgi:hypothetical protein
LEHRIYNTEKHIVEIEETKVFGSNGTMKETYVWEITIGSSQDDTYKGMSKEHTKGKTITWMELKTDKPLSEMIQYCKNVMSNKV